DEVYAILAYLLNLAEVVPADFELSDENLREVQERMPNRNGMTTDHGMWPGAAQAKGGIGNGGTPDVKNVACMKDCKKEVVIASALPDYAQDAHGNLAEQNRPVGQTRGKPTGVPAEGSAPGAAAEPAAGAAALALANAKGCMACHGVANKLVGPGYNEIAQKYQGQPDVEAKLVAKVKSGGQGVWGAVPMPPQGHVKDEELAQLVTWTLEGAEAHEHLNKERRDEPSTQGYPEGRQWAGRARPAGCSRHDQAGNGERSLEPDCIRRQEHGRRICRPQRRQAGRERRCGDHRAGHR